MDGNDREKFLNAGKPNDLPYELADGLDSDFKDFLRNKYAVAFLCNSFAGSNKYAGRFTPNEQADAGHIYVTPNQYVNGNLPLRTALEDISSTYYQYDLQVGGLKKEKESALQPLIVGAFERFRAVFTATVNSKGYSRIDVVEKKGNDRSHAQLMLTRV